MVLAAAAVAAGLGFGADEPLSGASLRVRTDRDPVTYTVGRPMTFTFYAVGERAAREGGGFRGRRPDARHPNAELDKVGLYDDLRPANDPYQFVYW